MCQQGGEWGLKMAKKKLRDLWTAPSTSSQRIFVDDSTHRGPSYEELTMQAAELNEADSRTDSDSDNEPLAKRSKADSPSTDSNTYLSYILKKLNMMEHELESLTPEDEMNMIDPDYMFILSVLPMMKRLTEIQKLQFRGNINDWLLEIVTQNEILGSM